MQTRIESVRLKKIELAYNNGILVDKPTKINLRSLILILL